MQLDNAGECLDIPSNAAQAVAGMQLDLVIRFPLQPTTHYLRFVGLPPSDAFQVATGGQGNALLCHLGTISFYGADRYLQRGGYVFLRRRCPLCQHFVQQALDSDVSQRFASQLFFNLMVFFPGIDRPGHFFCSRLSQGTAVGSVALEQYDPHLSGLKLSRAAQQAILSLGKDGLGYFGGKIEFLLHHIQETLLSTFSLETLNLVVFHHVHLFTVAFTKPFYIIRGDMCHYIHSLIKKAHESLAARLLLEEGFAGFAVARAYYTMLYLAQAFLLDQELSFSKHSAVIAAFGKEFVKSGILPTEFHRYLIDAQEMRLIADYQGK